MNSEISLAGQQLVTGDIETNNQMNKMLKIDGVEPIYTKCKTDESKKVSECVWNKIKEPQSPGDPDPNKKIREAVLAAAKTPNPNGEGAGAIPIAENFSTDPALKKLGELIGAKLQEALYGSDAEKNAKAGAGQFAAVDQKRFSEIYKAELGKTMLDAFMSYCLDTVEVGNNPIMENDKDVAKPLFEARRKKNLGDLQTSPITTLENGKGGEKWGQCLARVKDECINDDNVTKYRKVGNAQRDRACLVTQYVEAAKKNLNILKATDNFYTELGGGQATRLASAKSDAVLVTTTSKDIETSFKDSEQKINDDMKACQGGEEKKCKQFLNVKQKENEQGAVEFTLQQEADKANFEKKITDMSDDPEDLKKFLKERGYKDDEIAKMNLSDVKSVKDNIKLRYVNEKDALIKEINDRVNKKTAAAEDKIDSADADKNKLQKIADELQNRSKEMQNLTMFTNVVSGFLEGTLVDANGNKIEKSNNSAGPDRSTAALSAELTGNDNNQKLKEEIEKGGTKISLPTGSAHDEKQGSVDASEFINPADKVKK